MPTAVALLRGINLGPRNRIAMPALREALAAAGLPDARTYVQSGNIVLDTELGPDALADAIREVIAERFGLTVPVVVRTHEQLAAVVERDPLGEVATDPKRYHVVFLSEALPAAAIERLDGLRMPEEGFAAIDRELYVCYPEGSARSKLGLAAVDKRTGVAATARNWTTVTTLLEMTDA